MHAAFAPGTGHDPDGFNARTRCPMGLLGKQEGLAPSEVWSQLRVFKQGAMKLVSLVLYAGLIVKHGTAKTGRFFLP
jgi:hypothetical protein